MKIDKHTAPTVSLIF